MSRWIGESETPQPLGKRLAGIAMALALGTAGGAVAAHFQLPLAWMIGAMCATTVATISGAPLIMAPQVRGPMVAVLGVMLGSAFTPEIAARLADWLPAVAGITVYVATATGALIFYFRYVSGYDWTTSYFSASPGGLNEMIIVGGEMGGDERTIALSHAARVLLVVLIVPFAFVLIGEYDRGDRPPLGIPLLDFPLPELGILAACAIVGGYGAKRLRIPAAMVTGPMILSAAVHLAGLSTHRPPAELIAAAQIVLGTAIGCRFAGTPVATVLRILIMSVGATVVMLLLTVAFAYSLEPVIDTSFAAIVLAFAPGGLAEMSLIALALGIDAAFVATLHIYRIILLVIVAPTLFRRLHARRERARALNDTTSEP